MNNCVYCNTLAEDEDHIPSRNLYKGIAKKIKSIKVPSCKECNNGFSKDEVFFRDLIVSLAYEQSLSAAALFESAIKRSIIKTPGLAKRMFKQMELVDLYSKDGIFLGKKTIIKLKENDHERIFNVLDKYIKGLFYHHFRQPLLSDWVIKHYWLTPKLENKLANTLKLLKWQKIDENIFIYGYNFVPDTYQSIWCLIFFKRPLFISFVLDAATAQKKK